MGVPLLARHLDEKGNVNARERKRDNWKRENVMTTNNEEKVHTELYDSITFLFAPL